MQAFASMIFPALLVVGAIQSHSSEQPGSALQATDMQAPAHTNDLASLLARMQAADENPDPVARCREYPAPPGIQWTPESIRARCDLLAPRPEFISRGLTTKSMAESAVIFAAGFAALLDETPLSPATRDGRLYRAIDTFSNPSALATTEQWVSRSPENPFAHVAKGANLLAKATAVRGVAFANETNPNDLVSTSDYARMAAQEFQLAYSLEPRLAAACAMRTTALMLSSGSDAALDQGRTCTHAHPESYFAASAWATAAQPRWGGSKAALSEVSDFIRQNNSLNPLHASIVGSIDAYDLLAGGPSLSREQVKQLEIYASTGPNANLLNFISAAWNHLDEPGLWLAYLSSAIQFDINPGNRYRQMRARMTLFTRPAWAVIDYRILRDHYWADPSLDVFLAQAEQSVRDEAGSATGTGNISGREDLERKAVLLSECLHMGTSGREADRNMRNCSDPLITEWPNDPNAWFVRTRVLHQQGQPIWRDAAKRYLAIASATSSVEKRRIELIRSLLETPKTPPRETPNEP